jgi:prophage tail gpP-like protein
MVDDSPGALTIALSGRDRSARVIDARFEEPYEIAAGTNVETAILALVSYAVPDVVAVFPGLTFVAPQLRAAEGEDRWKMAQDIATSCGMELYFDGDGWLRLTPLLAGEAVKALTEGEGGVLLTATREWTREGTYNRVIATGENTGTNVPARGTATDDDPMSPTYYYGAYGKVPMFYVSQFIVTNAQATAAAMAMLDRQLGTTQTVSFGAIVDPSLEPSDTVQITRARAGIDEANALDSLTIPLTVGQPMTGMTRARLVTS